MDEPLSSTERRRRAPLHFWAKADNARMAAFFLWSASDEALAAAANVISYSSSTQIAAREAFRRESSIALELIIKAVIARRIEQKMAMKHVTRVLPTHDLSKLWEHAQLPALERADKLHIVQATQVLFWSGRYAAPKTDEALDADLDALSELMEVEHLSETMSFRRTQPLEWERFDKLYGVAATSFWKLEREWKDMPPSTESLLDVT